MTTLEPITASIDAYLGRNKYEVDEDYAHIALKEHPDNPEVAKLVRLCPAGLYKQTPEGTATFDWAGCLECGTCRIACGDTALDRWTYPKPTMGVEYRYG